MSVGHANDKCLIKCLLSIFSLVWTPMSTKLWGFSCFLIRNMFGSLVVCLIHLAPHVHFPCIGHASHIATSCTHLYYPCHALVYTLFMLACHVYLMLCSTLFVLGLSFIFSFILHPSCIIIIVCTFISCPRFSLTLCLFVTKRREYTLESIPKSFCHFYMALVHILRRRNSISRAHL